MNTQRRMLWIVLLAVGVALAACSSDDNSSNPDASMDPHSRPPLNNSNNTSGGHDCDVPADCEGKLGFLDPDAVECRLIPQIGFRNCAECVSNDECPEYYRCDASQFSCTLDSNQIDLNCETDADCAYLEDLDYFLDFSRVSCRENTNGARVCAECLSDEDCPDRPKCSVDTSFPYICGPRKLDSDMDFTDMDAGDMSAFDTGTSDMNAADAGD